MKVFLDMVGCRLNQSELETYAHQFRLAGHTLTSNPKSADLIVINTCAVTSAAASDSRQKVRTATRVGAGQVVVTGCWVTLYSQELAGISGISHVIGNQEKDNLVSSILNRSLTDLIHQSVPHEPIPGARSRTRSFIKVQDGCDNQCTYCVTRLARGPGRSREMGDIINEIQSVLDGGAQEVVLTGVHLGSWGYDFQQPSHISHLIRSILSDTETPRLRLSSLEPWDISPDFFELWQNPRLCRHLHLPLQSGCVTILRRMGRRITPLAYADLVQQARALISGVAITTDIITGFPGETERHFSESAAFVREMAFAGGHVFTYSARPGTLAAELPDQVPHAIAKQRNALMRDIFQECAVAFQAKHLGQRVQVLWEKALPDDDHQWVLSGLTDNNLRVCASSPSPYHNQIMDVLITELRANMLAGDITQA